MANGTDNRVKHVKCKGAVVTKRLLPSWKKSSYSYVSWEKCIKK